MERAMKLNLIFLLLDVLVVLAYPFLYIVNKVRQLLKLNQ